LFSIFLVLIPKRVLQEYKGELSLAELTLVVLVLIIIYVKGSMMLWVWFI